MAVLGLGECNRYLKIYPDDVSYSTPIKKLNKIKKHLVVAEYVAYLPGDKVAVCDRIKEAVRIYTPEGAYHKTLTKGLKPIGIATTASGMVAVVDAHKKEKLIKVFSSESGDMFSTWGEDFNWKPCGLAFSNKGPLVITDISKKKHSVGIYTLDGRMIHTFGQKNSTPDCQSFNNPNYVTVDMFDRILVSDRDNHVVKVFDDRGRYLGKIGNQPGKNPGQLLCPRGLCTDSRGNILVCDTGNRRVCLFHADGRHIQDLLTAEEDSIGYPYDIAYSRESNRLVVTQHSTHESGHVRKVSVFKMESLPPLHLEKL